MGKRYGDFRSQAGRGVSRMIGGETASGARAYELMKRLWPICRSITGPGVRDSLGIIAERLPGLRVHEVPTGTKCFDWTVPNEWSIRDAFVADAQGRRIVDFKENNLHVVGYSAPVDRHVSFEELQAHLHSLPTQPDAIPYVTSYYAETWGFCLTHRAREELRPGTYHVLIDSAFNRGSLTYGELILPGASSEEVFLSTYICHPSMANNELSGPCVTAELAAWLTALDRRYTYRIIFVPETIGALCYLSRHLEHLQKKVCAGYVLTCVGDERAWSFMPSREGNTLSDRVARHVLSHLSPGYTEYSFLERGSDERQYCSPGVDLPMASVMRSKYGTYAEYHTSLDDMSFVTASGLGESIRAYQALVQSLESQCIPKYVIRGEPMMGKRGLRNNLSKPGAAESGRTMMNILMFADGRRSLLEIADRLQRPVWELRPIVDQLVELHLLSLA